MATSATSASARPALTGGRLVPVAVAGLTALAFVLRIVGIDQTLYGDEYFTHAIVTGNGLGGVWDEVFHTSITPPLHYVLAWLSVQLGGDDTILVRLPSLILGTAIVPLVFLLGRRVGDVRAGLLAALLMALSPFAIWYSDEARAYAPMMFLVALSTLALLRALDGGGRRWWVVYALSACAALWTHYTAVFVIVAQAGWALWAHRERARELLLANAAVVVGFLPWLPGFLEQRRNDVGIEIIGTFARLSFGRVFELPLVTLVGHPFLPLRDAPAERGAILGLVLVALAIAAALSARGALGRHLPSPRSERGLVAILALATPVGLLLYDAVGSSLYLPRNLGASLPALVVLVALLVAGLAAAVPARVAALATAAFVSVLAAGAVASVVDDDQRRPAYREVAHYLDDVVAPSDPVLDTPLTAATEARFRTTTLDLYLERPHRLYAAGPGAAAAWRQLRAGRTLYLVAPRDLAARETVDRLLGGAGRPPAGLVRRLERLGGPDGRAILRGQRTFEGIFPIAVFRYAGVVDGRLERRDGRETISWSLGGRVPVTPGVARGAARIVAPGSREAAVAGWAVDARGPRPADWVLLFAGDRLIAVSAGGVPRSDVARVYGPSTLLAGFARPLGDRRSAIRAFALVGDRASELPLSRSASRGRSTPEP
jgi:4-amino-4-deoxy-L-arabinose transferase-like glycosyltransferase